MKLDAYLRKHGLSSMMFGRAVGLTKQTVHNYRHGLRFPSPENLRLIDEVTGGEVAPRDFVDQHAPDTPPGAPRPKRILANDAPTAKPKRRTSDTTPTSSAAAA